MLSTLHWFRRNLFLLVPKGRTEASDHKELLRQGIHRDRSGGSRWPAHRAGETIIGLPGQRWSFTMAGDLEIPPIYAASPTCSRYVLLAQIKNAEAQLTEAHEKISQI